MSPLNKKRAEIVYVPCVCQGHVTNCIHCGGAGEVTKISCRRCGGLGLEGGRKCLDCRGHGYRDMDQRQ